MKKNLSPLLIALLLFVHFAKAQTPDNEHVLRFTTAVLNPTRSQTFAQLLLGGNKRSIFDTLENLFIRPGFTQRGGQFTHVSQSLQAAVTDIDDLRRNTAIVVVARDIDIVTGGATVQFTPDVETVSSFVFSQVRFKTGFQSYLVGIKKLIIVYVDVDDSFYDAERKRSPARLSNTTIKMKYLTSYLKQSFKDLERLISGLGAMGGPTAVGNLKLTVVEIDPRSLKAPCEVHLQNVAFKEDLVFNIHEMNVASFQVGVVNNKLAANSFKISGDTLYVKADSAEKANWKSNLYASLELHLPRDIDNFEPAWKSLFRYQSDVPAGSGNKTLHRLYKMTLHRVGIYGGVKIGKDPLNNIYYGFNYALTRDVYLNFGWSRVNEIVPQVTEIGQVSSLSDALMYASRDYSKAKFSWGISLSPSALSKTLGLGDKSK